ncbi:DUF3152 domain-containing protein [Jidongwangia harbinensis]|uniref:DUF3152 domain-containing protein n=1 Tax=Jidongwangia harbinensis TaxID=2878561 RepID=UPI001CD9C456|nr:DUF3152 domain-containing protein [Jidongwangia harbinensis]MCA2213044.1 DUF3152 domain-containing protein [Jidongwangia harbinensis]
MAPSRTPSHTRPAAGRPPATSRAPAGPPEAVRPPIVVLPRDDAAPAAAGRRSLQRRRLVVVLAFVLLAAFVVVVGSLIRGDGSRRAAVPPVASVPAGPQPSAAVAPTTTAAAAAVAPPDVVGEFTFAGGYGSVLGTGGALRPFKVSVETVLGLGDGAAFAAEVERILGDPRGWIAGGDVRLQRVPAAAASDFTVYLASPDTSERMCRAGGLETGGFSSCRLPGQLVINQDRWQDAVPDYGAPLETYRAYAVNHEVGHQLGYEHESCPGPGQPAPVMQQQTYGLNGCVANAWPYIDGRRYPGPPAD